VAVIGNLTATGPTGPGYLACAGGGLTEPATSSLNFQAWASIAYAVTVAPSANGQLSIRADRQTEVIFDATGFIASSGRALPWPPTTPRRSPSPPAAACALVTSPEARRRGQPTHCDAPVVWRGRFRTRSEDVYPEDACEGHGEVLTHRSRVLGLDPP